MTPLSPVPVLFILLTTADRAQRTLCFTRSADNGIQTDEGEWDANPALGTDSALLTVQVNGEDRATAQLTGSQWRKLEDNEMVDQIVASILQTGLELENAIKQALNAVEDATYEVICYASRDDFDRAHFSETDEDIVGLKAARDLAKHQLSTYPVVKIQSTSQETGEVIFRDEKAQELAATPQQALDAPVGDFMPLLQKAVTLANALAEDVPDKTITRQKADELVLAVQQLATVFPVKVVTVSSVDGFDNDALVLVPGWMSDSEADRRIEEGIVAANLEHGKYADLDAIAAEWRKRGILHQPTRTATAIAWDCTFATALAAVPQVLQRRTA